MKNKTQENEKKTIIPKQKKQRSVKKEKSAVTKKTAKKTRNSSMAVKLVAILVLMVAVTMVSNVINYDAMVKMNHSIKDVTDSKVPDLQNAYNIQYSLEAVQKDFYRYLATTKGETSHTEARNMQRIGRLWLILCSRCMMPQRVTDRNRLCRKSMMV